MWATPTFAIVTPDSIRYGTRYVSPNTLNGARYAGVSVRDSVPFDLQDDLGIERHNERIWYYDTPKFPKNCTRCKEGSLLLCEDNETINCSHIGCTR